MGALPLERLVGRVLRWGVLLSGGLMMTGFVLSIFRQTPGEAVGADALRLLSLPLADFLLHPGSWLLAGAVTLMATPILRVIIAVFSFAAERDWRYVAISAVVLPVILLSIALAVLK